MNFFEKELRKLFWGDDTISAPFYVDGVCFGRLGREHLVQVEFISTQIEHQYDALKIIVVHRASGRLSSFEINLKDFLGEKAIYRGFEGTSLPYMWVDMGDPRWPLYYPTWEDRQQLLGAVKKCLDGFSNQASPPSPSPKLVYICAPLRGDVEKNIEFVRQKAREVFQTGDVPVCPHLMFPPIADPCDPSEDQAAREMGLRLVAICQQVNVYGGECTAGMQEEIDLARNLGMPVKIFAKGDC